jgi:hypothetical protein
MNGFAMGFIFVPLTTITLSRLRKQEMGNATGIFNLMRNIGGSIGIASVMAMMVRGAQTHQTTLAADAGSPLASGFVRGLQARLFSQGTDMVTAHQKALGALYSSVQQQSSLLAYADNFRLDRHSRLLLCHSAAPALPASKKALTLSADQQAGDVVVAAGAIGGIHQACAEFIERQIGSEHGFDQRVGEFAGQPIGAKQKEIADFGL